jgi:hypothetical protein
MNPLPLTERDLAMLAESYITAELAMQAGLFRVDSEEGGRLVGRNGHGDYAGIVFPNRWPGEDRPREYRLRRDHPDLEEQPDGLPPKEKGKYLTPPGRGNKLYFPPNTDPADLQNKALPVIIVEGEKKCLAMHRLSLESGQRFLTIALAGVWSWRGNVGKAADARGARRDVKGVIGDFDRIKWAAREVSILFDSNIHTNDSVRAARKYLSDELKRRKAKVFYVNLPWNVGLNGVDDFLASDSYAPEYVLAQMQEHRSRCSLRSRLERGEQIERGDLFVSKPMNEWLKAASSRPKPKPLFGPFWTSGEIAFLFGDTGLGKTILAMQIANDIANGKSTTGLELEVSGRVDYFDFELSDTQHLQRYGNEDWSEFFAFSENLHRVEMDLSQYQHVTTYDVEWEMILLDQIDRKIAESESRIIVIDNITWLSRETDKGKFALPLMQRLSALKKERDLSMLIACHTPKRDETRPISVNDLAGSKILANFADSIFAIGKSVIDPGRRYLKQIKERSSEKVYGSESVAVFDLHKSESRCFLGFEFIDTQPERKHLKELSQSEHTKRIQQAKELKAQNRSFREIANEMEISVSTAHKYVNTETPQTPPTIMNTLNVTNECERLRTGANAEVLGKSTSGP